MAKEPEGTAENEDTRSSRDRVVVEVREAFVVDEAGRDDLAACIDLLRRVTGHFADLRYKPVLDGDVSGEAFRAGAIDDGPATNDNIECWHGLSPISICNLSNTVRRALLWDRNDRCSELEPRS